MYKYTCRFCGRIRFEPLVGIVRETACYGPGGCGSVAFDCQKREWVKDSDSQPTTSVSPLSKEVVISKTVALTPKDTALEEALKAARNEAYDKAAQIANEHVSQFKHCDISAHASDITSFQIGKKILALKS